MHIEEKLVNGQRYLYAVRSGRVNGKPRRLEQIYLGKLEDLVAARRGGLQPKSVRSRRFGAVAALWALSEELGLRALIDTESGGARGPGASVGTYLVLAAINRVIDVRSKNGFAEWYRTTSLERLAGVAPELLSSQAFWTAMDRFPAAAGNRILSRLLPRLLVEAGSSEVVSFDCSNFFTFIASGNQRSQLARRGHSKAKRHDLRQVGLALAVSASGQLPLFYHLYAGDQPDSKTFGSVWPELLEALRGQGLGQATLVYDKGNLSKANQNLVDEAGVSYVTSFAPHLFPELLAVPLDKFQAAPGQALEGYLWQREERQLWGRSRVLVQSWSPELAAGQEAGLRQHLAKAERRLQALQESLERRQQPGRGGRKPSPEVIEKVVAAALSAQHLRRLVKVEIKQQGDLFKFSYEVDQVHLEHLQNHLFGRRIWVSDRGDWSSEQILAAAHQQNDAEACFRDLHGELPAAWSPMWHWTDQKVSVHAFYMLLALLLARLLRLRARRAGDQRETAALIRDLASVDESWLAYPAGGATGQGRPRVVHQLNECSPQQHRLLQATGALAFAPPI